MQNNNFYFKFTQYSYGKIKNNHMEIQQRRVRNLSKLLQKLHNKGTIYRKIMHQVAIQTRSIREKISPRGIYRFGFIKLNRFSKKPICTLCRILQMIHNWIYSHFRFVWKSQQVFNRDISWTIGYSNCRTWEFWIWNNTLRMQGSNIIMYVLQIKFI